MRDFALGLIVGLATGFAGTAFAVRYRIERLRLQPRRWPL